MSETPDLMKDKTERKIWGRLVYSGRRGNEERSMFLRTPLPETFDGYIDSVVYAVKRLEPLWKLFFLDEADLRKVAQKCVLKSLPAAIDNNGKYILNLEPLWKKQGRSTPQNETRGEHEQ